MSLSNISFIIPCYNCAGTIESVVREIEEAAAALTAGAYEIILVNDASPDGAFSVINSICEENPRVKAIDLAKNFGQHSAIMAGVKHAGGDILVFLDDDGQTPANEAGKLINAIEGGLDVVFAEYDERRQPFWRRLGSRVNDLMAEALIDKPKNLYISSYCACKRFVADELRKYDGKYPYMTGLLLRAAGRAGNVPVTHRARAAGTSNYTLKKLLALWFNGFTAFSVKPLRVATFMGFLLALSGFLYGAYVIIKRFLFSEAPMGWSSIMAALMFIGGMIMVMLGLIGEYVGRVYININKAPQYIIRRTINLNCPGVSGDGSRGQNDER